MCEYMWGQGVTYGGKGAGGRVGGQRGKGVMYEGKEGRGSCMRVRVRGGRGGM